MTVHRHSLTFEAAIQFDAYEVARRTLRYKFGRLSNHKIVARSVPWQLSDADLLARWFTEFDSGARRVNRRASSHTHVGFHGVAIALHRPSARRRRRRMCSAPINS
jgi:hypothetical protein